MANTIVDGRELTDGEEALNRACGTIPSTPDSKEWLWTIFVSHSDSMPLELTAHVYERIRQNQYRQNE